MIVFKALIVKIKLLVGMERLKMVEGYTILIMNGLATIERVPTRHKEAVLSNLETLGLDGYGNPLPIEEPTA